MGIDATANLSYGIPVPDDIEVPWRGEDIDTWYENQGKPAPPPVEEVTYGNAHDDNLPLIIAVKGCNYSVFQYDEQEIEPEALAQKPQPNVEKYREFLAEFIPELKDAEPKWYLTSELG